MAVSSSVLPGSVQLSEQDFRHVRDTVHELTGISLHEGKRELVVARLSKRIRQLGMKSVGEYLKYVREERTQQELITMLDALSTNLTGFWREPQHFEYLAKVSVPRILQRCAQSGDSRVRGWSAGCSSGEEPYSLMMLLLAEIERPERHDLRLLATDLSTRMLSIARAGAYSAERVKALPSPLRMRFIVVEESEAGRVYRVTDEVKSHIVFARLNLMESWPMRGPLDFIFCRNVMIYFDKATQAQLVRRFYELLRPGGTLFIGHSESLTGIEHNFQYVRPTVYEKP
jgi:chemotaxis protein methyltransferase CheR